MNENILEWFIAFSENNFLGNVCFSIRITINDVYFCNVHVKMLTTYCEDVDNAYGVLSIV